MKIGNKPLIRTTLLISAVAFSSSVVSQEQFSLDGDSEVLFDGEIDVQTTGTMHGIQYEVIQGHAVAQGDMVLGKVFADGRIAKSGKRGLGQSQLVDRWPDGIVPYQFADDITSLSRQRSQEAIQHWTDRTGITFIARTAENASQFPDYVNFEPSEGCASWVGRVGLQQAIWVSDNCTTGSIIHEIGHAIGLFHEHTRPDRDNFITINWNNIVDGKSFNFDVLTAGVDQLGPYDYGSIMHYGELFFSSNGGQTIETSGVASIGQRNALSAGDTDGADTLYQTDLSLVTNASTTENGVEVDVNVSNNGDMGANTLQLIITMGDSADWLSISTDSGWECQAFETELRCTRTTLNEFSQSRFTLLVDPKGAETSELSARLVSRTRDTDSSNNTFNFDGTATEAEQIVVPQAEPSIDLDEDDNTGTSSESQAPELGQATEGAGGNGGGGAVLWLALLAWISKRSRNKR